MKRFAVLTGLEIKKSVKTMPRLIVGAVLLLIIVFSIALFANGLLNEKPEFDEESKISIGVVCYDDSAIMDMAKNMLGSIKTIKENLNLIFTYEDEAMDNLEKGNYMAVIVIPDKAVEHIISGKNTPIDVVFPENAGYEAAIFKELADAAVNLLASSQAGIYSVYDFYGDNYRRLYIAPALERLNARYIKTVILREDFFKNTTVVATGKLDVMEYYMVSGMVLFMFLFGINSITFTESYRREIINALCNSKVGVLKQTIARFTGTFCIYAAFVMPITAAAGMIGNLSPERLLLMICAMVPVVMVVSSVILLIQILIPHKPSAVLVIFLISVFQGFVTGGFIPEVMLPKAVGSIGKITPAYYMIEQIRIVYMGEMGIVVNTIILLLISAAVLVLASLGMNIYKGNRR